MTTARRRLKVAEGAAKAQKTKVQGGCMDAEEIRFIRLLNEGLRLFAIEHRTLEQDQEMAAIEAQLGFSMAEAHKITEDFLNDV